MEAGEGRKIFVDTNAFLFFLRGEISEDAERIFRGALKNRFKLVTSTRVVDEFIFKLIVLRAGVKLKKKGVDKLRKKKGMVKELSAVAQFGISFLKDFGVEVKEVRWGDYKGIPEIMKKYGLFGNDAVTVKVMRRYNIIYLLSDDRDFDEVEWIRRIPVRGK